MDTNLLPALDPAGLPGPTWLFHVLLVFTFFLHMLFMNLTLGGTIVGWIAHLRSSDKPDDANGVLAARLVKLNGFGISLTITTGVAPLLFVQILYQQFFYSATILLGWIWFAFLVILTLGYYSIYLYKFSGKARGGRGRGIWLGLSALAFVLIAMVHVAVNLIHAQPNLWTGFAANSLQVLGDAAYWPRLLHFILAGIAFSALVMTWWASRQARHGIDASINTAIARSGWRWALWSIALQVVDGFILLLVLPQDVLLGTMRGGVTTLAPLTLSILLGIGLLIMLARSMDPIAKPSLVTGTLAAMVLTVGVMSITRHQVRDLYLESAAPMMSPQVAPQWLNFSLFVILLLAALATVYYMARRVLREPATGENAA